MRKIKLHGLFFAFIIIQLNGMDKKKYFSEPQSFPMPPLSKKVFWLETSDGQLIKMNYRYAKKYPLLSYYIARFGYANGIESPLKIGCKE